MGAFIVGLLLLLGSFDPLGSWLVQQYPIQVRQGLPTGAAADLQNRTILVDPDFMARVYKNPDHARIWSSCLLVHESVHLRENTAREDLPNAFTYVCLDRLGAPLWMKDHLYQLLKNQVIVPPKN